MNNPSRPVLRWHGGKWKLAPWLISLFPAHRVYVEPFGGAASVLMRKQRSYAEVYNDLDGEVVNLFRLLRDPVTAGQLRWAVEMTPFAREEFSGAYELTDDPVEQARRMLIRSWMGHGTVGGCRIRKTGFRRDVTRGGGTPARDWLNWPDQISAFTDRLTGVHIENLPAIDVIRNYDTADTLFYVDPPYVFDTRTSVQNGTYRHEMTDGEHTELAALLRQIKGMVILSGYPCPLYERLYPDWTRLERKAYADGAKERTEVIWMNDAAARASAQGERLL